ncbi:glutamine synthetase family protein [Microbaculum marinisediminis]|uniref:Glutamine synthetase family protein n=1 Tax=Microbaculum marinisediminis TaxID=2931392 RepID=A0AAW5R0X9_9HYPH|nr:glutamine synthetase family protein [Microbaculum sp. A6E488]MCT8972985.1 glutamine synthetase family protein [Microbaculum sp. A6E488]
MPEEPLIMVCVGDISGNVRGKAIPLADYRADRPAGIGWTPTNVQLTCFGTNAETPYGPFGDLVMTPIPTTEARVAFGGAEAPAEHLVIAELTWPDGTPWECCTRTILRRALEALHAETGLTVRAAFEHEFMFVTDQPTGGAYTIGGVRRRKAFGETVLGALREAGMTPQSFLREFGPNQYEVSVAPARGVTAADDALVLRELARAAALSLGEEITFTPLIGPHDVGNGVHVHFDFLDDAGTPVTADPDAPEGISATAAAFVAGVLRHLPSTVALTAPSVPSYTRLTPHRWSAAFNNLGYRDREAAVRICPRPDGADVAPGERLHFEYRAADAAANPHLVLAALVLAGLQGVRDGLPLPSVTREDLTRVAAADLKARGIDRLPASLDDAIARLDADTTVRSWFPEKLVDVYVAHKRGEMAFLKGKTEDEICAAYSGAY